MSSGGRFRSVRTALLGALCTAACLVGGCASGDLAAERTAERRATLDRWTHCLERQSGVAALSEVRARLAHGCEGHRRDVLRAFPPHMAPRLTRLMDERTETLLRTRLREEGRHRDANEPRLRHLLDALSAG